MPEIFLWRCSQVQPPNRFTTNPGFTAAELIASDLGLPVTPSLLGGTDYAFGGAGLVNTFQRRSDSDPAATAADVSGANGGAAEPNALYQVWGGANDIFYLSATSTDPNVLSDRGPRLPHSRRRSGTARSTCVAGRCAVCGGLQPARPRQDPGRHGWRRGGIGRRHAAGSGLQRPAELVWASSAPRG